MLWTMIRKEWLRNLLEPRFLLCAALCIFLALVSVLVLRADLAAKRADYNSNREIYRQQAEEYGSYRDLQRRGIRVDRPPQDFQVLFLGTEKTMDRTAEVTGDFMPGFAGDLNINPMVLMFPVADLLFIVGVVLSLLAFFISYVAVAGEREEGSLMLLLSYSVPRDTVILAKWIGGYLSLALPFIVSLLVSALLISLSSEIPFEGQNWQAFIVTGAVSLLLIAVMFSFGLLVSVRARRSSSAILSLLALWVLLALVLPNAGPFLAEIINPVPDVGEIERKIAESTRGLNQQYRGQWRGGRGRMRGMSDEQRRELREEMHLAREKLQTDIIAASEKIIRDFERQLRRQMDTARNLTRISPVAAYVYANTDIGETGVRHEQQLINGLRAYQRQFSLYVDEKSGDGGGDFGWGQAQGEEYSIEDMPVFSFRAESLEGRLAARSTDILLLLIFAVLFLMLAFVSFLRTDIT